MKQYKFYWISSLIIFLWSCSSAPPVTPMSLNQIGLDSNNIQEYYCKGNKQVRDLVVNTEYIIPKIPSGIAIDDAAKKQAYLSKRKDELTKRILFSLSGGEERSNGRGANYLKARQSEHNHKDLVESVSENTLEENSYSSKVIRALLMKPTDSNKFILLYGLQIEGQFSMEDYNDPAHISELKTLVDNFTLLEPLQVQIDNYDTHAGTCYGCGKDSPIGIDERGNQVISKYLRSKDDVWLRYIKRFTSVKEGVAKNPRIINLELNLDLNGFCKYGRAVSDLQSQ